MSRTLNNYCPKCKQKKLSRRRYRGDPHNFWQCFNRACGLAIEHPDRDAEISDYHGPLGQMARLEERIQDYFAQHEEDVYQKGFEVLFEGDIFFVVRHRYKDHGLCVGLYCKADTVDKDDEDVFNPRLNLWLLEHDAAKGIAPYRGNTALGIIPHSQYWPTFIWTSGKPGVFKGRLTKALRAQIVEWATGFEKVVPGLIDDARRRVKAWRSGEEDLENYVKGTGVSIHFYNHYDEKVALVRLKPLSIKKCYKLDAVLPEPLKIQLINDKDGIDYVTTEQADQVRKLLKIKKLRADACVEGRLTIEQIKQVADALRPIAKVEVAS